MVGEGQEGAILLTKVRAVTCTPPCANALLLCDEVDTHSRPSLALAGTAYVSCHRRHDACTLVCGRAQRCQGAPARIELVRVPVSLHRHPGCSLTARVRTGTVTSPPSHSGSDCGLTKTRFSPTPCSTSSRIHCLRGSQLAARRRARRRRAGRRSGRRSKV